MNNIEFEKPNLLLVDGTKHKLLSDWIITFRGEEYRVPMDFVTDGASIPFWLQPICGDPNKVPRVYAALVHDWLYSGGDREATRADADDLYRDMQIALGVPRWKAYVEWGALRLFGRSHWSAAVKVAMAAVILAATGCCRTIDIVVNGEGAWEAHYANYGLKTDVSSIEAEKTAEGVIKVKVEGLTTDVSAENKEIVAAGGTAVGNVAEKIIDGIKK